MTLRSGVWYGVSTQGPHTDRTTFLEAIAGVQGPQISRYLSEQFLGEVYSCVVLAACDREGFLYFIFDKLQRLRVQNSSYQVERSRPIDALPPPSYFNFRSANTTAAKMHTL